MEGGQVYKEAYQEAATAKNDAITREAAAVAAAAAAAAKEAALRDAKAAVAAAEAEAAAAKAAAAAEAEAAVAAKDAASAAAAALAEAIEEELRTKQVEAAHKVLCRSRQTVSLAHTLIAKQLEGASAGALPPSRFSVQLQRLRFGRMADAALGVEVCILSLLTDCFCSPSS